MYENISLNLCANEMMHALCHGLLKANRTYETRKMLYRNFQVYILNIQKENNSHILNKARINIPFHYNNFGTIFFIVLHFQNVFQTFRYFIYS